MADVFKGIITADGKKRQLPYENVLKTPVSDETLSKQGAFADAKVVGDKFKEVKVETNSLKEDINNIVEEITIPGWFKVGYYSGEKHNTTDGVSVFFEIPKNVKQK